MKATIQRAAIAAIMLSVVQTSQASAIIIHQFEFNGVKYFQHVTSEDLARYPTWKPEYEPCPLAATNAIFLARQCTTRLFPEVPKRWILRSVNIRQIGGPRENYWVYLITLEVHGDASYPLPSVGGIQMASVTLEVGINGWIPDVKSSQGETRITPNMPSEATR